MHNKPRENKNVRIYFVCFDISDVRSSHSHFTANMSSALLDNSLSLKTYRRQQLTSSRTVMNIIRGHCGFFYDGVVCTVSK